MLRLLPAVLVSLAYAASSANAAIVFHIGGGEMFSFQQDSGIHALPIYISTDGSDSFDAVEFFLAGSAPGVVPGNSDGDIVGSVGQTGMVGSSVFAGGVVERAFNEYARLDATYNASVVVPLNTMPLNDRQFASLFVDTSLLSPGTHSFSDAGFVAVYDGGNLVEASINSGSFQVTAVPEPTSFALVSLAGVGALVWHRRRVNSRTVAHATAT